MNLSRRGFLGSLFMLSIGAATTKAAAEFLAPLGVDPMKPLAAVAPAVDFASLNGIFKQVYLAYLVDLVPPEPFGDVFHFHEGSPLGAPL